MTQANGSSRRSPPAISWLACLLLLAPLALAGPGDPPRGAKEIPRYPPSFRQEVARAIERGMARITERQHADGHWGNAADKHAMGHTALPLVALLKGGTEPSAEPVRRGFGWLRKQEMTSTYGVACYLMAIHARYAPKAETYDTDVDEASSSAAESPDAIRARLTDSDLDVLQRGLAWLDRAQASNGLWHYHVQEGDRATRHDLSNTQYAILGLRAVSGCGVKVPPRMWLDALDGLHRLQARDGPKVKLLEHREKDGYVFERKESAKARGFRYRMGMKHGPKGEYTVPTFPETGTMTTAGIASILICREGLWGSRRFRGKDRRQSDRAVRDGFAWLQEHYAIRSVPGHDHLRRHLYYLYGLERACMLAGRRFVGGHDWYKEGADLLLELEAGKGWGDHARTAFAILFLKRATRRPPPEVTGN